ncbi:MAG: transcription termination/antitermination protein NusG [Chloroflexi bacterium]|nr:transcription termination/antitermination protein NusG [Chloroflexota bacterium]MDA1146817.1 transcription termination/antitermination protein NusG [Chloroflexota bacterium]MQC82431.1 transcription termination/antitermination protein NusG [Chloroflexota bacterium]
MAPEPLSAQATDDAANADVDVEVKDGRAWYIVQTYSGYENKVKVDLEQRIKSMDMSERIHQVVVPTEDEIEIRDGQRKTVSKKLFPGYVFVQMLMDDESWYVVRNTPGVTGFAGTTMDERAKPTALPDAEVEQILRQMHSAAPRINIGFQVGETVLVTDGPFSEMIGTVDTIDLDRGRVRVMVSMFGRDTPVELDFLQVEKQ